MYCYQVLPVGPRGGVIASSAEVCLAPNTRSLDGGPTTFTVRLNQSNTASLSWTAAGGQDGFRLTAKPSIGAPRSVLLPVGATSTTDNTLGLMTCYTLEPMLNGVALGKSDQLCAVPGTSTATAAVPSGATPADLSLPTLIDRARKAAGPRR
jgi:hypothetical protein